MEKNIILIGKTNTGKDTVTKILIARGYKRNVTITTRAPRPKEKNGIDYYFVSDEEFNKLWQDGVLAERTEYNTTSGKKYYASFKKSYNEKGTVMILNPGGIKAIRKLNLTNNSIIVLLEAPEDTLRMRAIARGDKAAEIERRLAKDRLDFQDCYYDIKIDETIANTPSKIVNEIDSYINLLNKVTISKKIS